MKENDPKANLVSLLANFFVAEGIVKICWFGKQATSDPPSLNRRLWQKTVWVRVTSGWEDEALVEAESLLWCWPITHSVRQIESLRGSGRRVGRKRHLSSSLRTWIQPPSQGNLVRRDLDSWKLSPDCHTSVARICFPKISQIEWINVLNGLLCSF